MKPRIQWDGEWCLWRADHFNRPASVLVFASRLNHLNLNFRYWMRWTRPLKP